MANPIYDKSGSGSAKNSQPKSTDKSRSAGGNPNTAKNVVDGAKKGRKS